MEGGLAEEEARLIVFVDEACDDGMCVSQDLLSFGRGAIRGTKPDDFGRHASENAALLEIRVFGHNREAVSFGVFPNCLVRGACEAAGVHMRRTGIDAS